MPIITITHDSFTHGKDIAEKVAENLGCECIGPEVIQQDCGPLRFPLIRGAEAPCDSPGFFSHFGTEKERCLALFRAAFFERMGRDDIVYHGSAGHIFLAEVPNVVKVRITADFDERIREKSLREGLSYDAAKKKMTRGDKEQAKRVKQICARDNRDPALYDLYLNLHHIRPDAAVAIISTAAQTSTNGDGECVRRQLKDMALEAKVEARLLEVFSDVEVIARDGALYVSVEGSILQEEMIIEKARGIISELWDVDRAKIGVAPSIYVPF